MTTIVRPAPAGAEARPDERARASRWAWAGVLLIPVTTFLGFVVAFSLANLMEIDLFSWEQTSAAEYALAMVPAVIVWLSAPLLAVVMGLRAIARGSRSAYAAVVLGIVPAVYVLYDVVTSLIELAG